MAIVTKVSESPHIWIYTLRQIYRNLDFPTTATLFDSPDQMTDREIERLGRSYSAPELATNDGLDNPVLIHVDDKVLPFVSSIGFYPHKEPDRSYDERRRQLPDRLSEELQGNKFDIWAMKLFYPDHRLVAIPQGEELKLFDDSAKPSKLRRLAREVYKSFVEYDKEHDKLLEDQKPVALGWYTTNRRFRVITRPYKPEGGHHRLAVATTLKPTLI